MPSSNMLLLNLIPLIDVTFSTPTRYFTNQAQTLISACGFDSTKSKVL
jgi:hypothetical protein